MGGVAERFLQALRKRAVPRLPDGPHKPKRFAQRPKGGLSQRIDFASTRILATTNSSPAPYGRIGDGEIWQPDFSDPLYLKYWGELVAEAGKRYDGNPYLDSVDISSVGYWGEGWSPYMPPFSNQKELIDIWLNAFRRTPLLINFD